MKNGIFRAGMIIFACVAILTVSGCRHSVVQDTIAADIGSTAETTTQPVTKPATESIDSKAKLTQLLKAKTTGNILTFAYGDYDKDGKNEAFAFSGTRNNSENVYAGELWYVNANGAKKLMEKDAYWEVCKKLDFEKRSYCDMEKYYATGSASYVWGVVNGEAKKEAISGKVNGLKMADGVLLGTQSAYDMTYDKASKFSTGHTWKSYYFYDDNGIKEYGGRVITEDKFLRFEGSSNILIGIENEGCKVTNIIYRNNGIININYYAESSSSIDYHNIKVKYDKTHVKVIGTEEGIYLTALVPDIATYPNEILPKFTFDELVAMLDNETIKEFREKVRKINPKGNTEDLTPFADEIIEKVSDKTGIDVNVFKDSFSFGEKFRPYKFIKNTGESNNKKTTSIVAKTTTPEGSTMKVTTAPEEITTKITLVPREIGTKVTTVPKETTTGIGVVIKKAMNDPDIKELMEKSEYILKKGSTGDIASVADELVQKLAEKTGLSVEAIRRYLSDLNSRSFRSTY